MSAPWQQSGSRVRFDWGLSGLRALLDGADPPPLVVVVDVLSFSTAVTVAVERGVLVRPVPPGPAAEVPADAVRAGARGDGRVSLSPASFRGLAPGTRVVLPSPNGAAVSAAADAAGAVVLAGCIRNAAAAAAEVAARLDEDPHLAVLVLAAGERWPDGSLRVAVEDLAGAARILGGLPAALLSPEARAAASLRVDAADLAECASASELVARGYRDDVRLALTADAGHAVPILDEGWFRPSYRG